MMFKVISLVGLGMLLAFAFGYLTEPTESYAFLSQIKEECLIK